MWGYIVAGGLFVGAVVTAVVIKNRALDDDMPPDLKNRVKDALAHETDPSKLEAMADTLSAYPKAQALLRAKAAKLRTAQHKVNPPPVPPSGGQPVPKSQPTTAGDNASASSGDTVVPAGGGGTPDSGGSTGAVSADPVPYNPPAPFNPTPGQQGTNPNNDPQHVGVAEGDGMGSVHD